MTKSTMICVIMSMIFMVGVVSATKYNILHLTDVHGWINGHPHSAKLNSDFGDFYSLTEHMRANAKAAGEEFFLFDTGDLVEGTGLSDATPIHGQYIFPIAQRVGYDGITIGNHDIGHADTVSLMRSTFIPALGTAYVTSNSLDKASGQPIGSSYRVIDTPLGNRVLVLGYIFNFEQNADNTIVVNMTQSLKQPYFQQAMQTPGVDLIVTLNHIDPDSQKYLLKQQWNAIRASFPTTPIVMLAGHRHVTWFEMYDANSFSLESGRYFEKMGLVTLDIPKAGQLNGLTQFWPDTSLTSLYNISRTTESTFPTAGGAAIKKEILSYWNQLDLGHVWGCSPQQFSPYANFSTNDSLYRLWITKAAPSYLNPAQPSIGFFFINTAAMRDNVYKGPVTRNDILSVYPFTDDIIYFQALAGSDLQTLINSLVHIRSLESMNLGVPLRHTCPEPELDGRQMGEANSVYVWSQFGVDVTKTYDVLMPAYDARNLQIQLQRLFPGRSFPTAVYPGVGGVQWSNAQVLSNFIEKNWPC